MNENPTETALMKMKIMSAEERLALEEGQTGEPENEGEPLDHEVVARRLDEEALALAAQEQATIASVGGRARILLTEALERGEFSTEDTSCIEQELDSLQQARMAEIRGDTRVRVANLGPGVLGMYDGENITLAPDGIEYSIYAHEGQHEEDGLPHQDLDATLAADTGIAAVDEELQDVTLRDHLEDRATETEQKAGGEGSQLYLETHVQTVNAINERGREAGVDMDAAANDLIENNDVEGYQESLLELAVREAAENPEELAELEAEAQETAPEIVEIIAEVRADYENGPDAKSAREELVSLAA